MQLLGKGYDSLVAYFPGIDVSIAVASNIETDNQAQPADAMCYAYNAVLAGLLHLPQPNCTYVSGSYHRGVCDCGNSYVCDESSQQCLITYLCFACRSSKRY